MTDTEYLNFMFDKFMEVTGSLYNYDLVFTYDRLKNSWTIYSLDSAFVISLPLSDIFPSLDIESTTTNYTEADFLLTLSDKESLIFYDNGVEYSSHDNDDARDAFCKNFRIVQ